MATLRLSQDFDVQELNVVQLSSNPMGDSANQENTSSNLLTNTVSTSPNSFVTTSQLAKRYAVGDRSVQLWIKRLMNECGIIESRLKENSGNQTTYTAYCVELLDSLHSHRSQGKKIGQWFSNLSQEQTQQGIKTVTSQLSPTGPEESSGSSSERQLAIVAGVVPGEIALATDQQQSMLDSAIERFAPQPTHLNGQQESNLSGLEVLIGAVDQATAINDQRESELHQREATVEKSEQVLELVRDRLQTEQKRSKTLNQQAADIGEREQVVSDLLGKLGISQ